MVPIFTLRLLIFLLFQYHCSKFHVCICLSYTELLHPGKNIILSCHFYTADLRDLRTVCVNVQFTTHVSCIFFLRIFCICFNHLAWDMKSPIICFCKSVVIPCSYLTCMYLSNSMYTDSNQFICRKLHIILQKWNLPGNRIQRFNRWPLLSSCINVYTS